MAEGELMTLGELYSWGREELQKNSVADAQLDAWYLLEYVSGVSRAMYYAYPEKELAESDAEHYRSLIRKRAERIPLQHLTGSQEFMGLEFKVNDSVLIPRQDTEILVEHALEMLQRGMVPSGQRGTAILDMCTGSGCILLSVLAHAGRSSRAGCPSSVGVGKREDYFIVGTGADISAEALVVAEENSRRLGLQASFVQGDLFENISGRYGMILSNPPYIRTDEIAKLQDEVRLHDPLIALDGRKDGLYFYRRITEDAEAFLEHGGILMFEIGCDQAEAVSALMEQNGYKNVTVKKDLAGLDRVVSGVLQ